VVRTALALVQVLFLTTVGVGLLLLRPWSWFWAAGGLVLFSQAVLSFGVSRHLAPVRRRVGLSTARSLQVMCATKVGAGVFAFVGALTSLDRAFGIIVAFGAFSWIWGWAGDGP
jgi:hypothetical protein